MVGSEKKLNIGSVEWVYATQINVNANATKKNAAEKVVAIAR